MVTTCFSSHPDDFNKKKSLWCTKQCNNGLFQRDVFGSCYTDEVCCCALDFPQCLPPFLRPHFENFVLKGRFWVHAMPWTFLNSCLLFCVPRHNFSFIEYSKSQICLVSSALCGYTHLVKYACISCTLYYVVGEGLSVDFTTHYTHQGAPFTWCGFAVC